MGSHPTLSELERAILCYTSPSLKSGLQDWQAMEWLWVSLSWRARFITHFGASGSSWWKERYILPLLCKQSIPFLQRFLDGEWTRAEEESLRHCFHFFASYAAKTPELFPSNLISFLAGPCPSFNTERDHYQSRLSAQGMFKNCSWFGSETFAHYRSRMESLAEKTPSRKQLQKEERASTPSHEEFDVIKNETREKSRRLLEEMTALRNQISENSSRVEQNFSKAFPIRQEAENAMTEFHNVKDEMLSILMGIDGALIRVPDQLSRCLSNADVCQIIHDEELSIKSFQKKFADLRTRGEKQHRFFEELRAVITKRLYDLTRALDHIPMLESTNPFRLHQARLVRSAREKLKRFRTSLSKGPGPQMLLSEIEQEIFALVDLARAFYDEGTDIAVMKERLHDFEHRIQKMLSEASPPPSPRAGSLEELLEDVTKFMEKLEVASDRKHRFEHIDQALRDLEVRKS